MKHLFLLLLFVFNSAFAKIEIHHFEDPEKEAIYKDLIAELRCLVCQNQNLADSNAELAKDLRNKTYQMVKAGKTRSNVIDYMVTRYGDFVLYSPPFKNTTLVLWIGPFILLPLSLIFLFIFLRKQSNVGQSSPYSEQQLKRVRKILHQDNNK